MINDMVSATGKLHIQVFDAEGNLKTEYHKTNLVVDTGLAYITSRMKDATATAMSHMAVGSGTAGAASGNTALGTELGRVALTSTTVTANSIAYVGDFPAGVGTGSVSEAGIFNASSGGTMLCRSQFGVVTKAAADSMRITWTVTIS